MSWITSEWIDQVPDHKIMMTNAEAAWINAREAAIITKSLAQSRVELAQLTYDFAELDLKKYLGEGGEYATDLVKAKGNIALAQQEVKKNDDYYTWSKRLAQEKYLSTTQLQADELTLRKSELNLTVANNSLNLLEKYTYQRDLAQLQSDVNQARRRWIGRRPGPGPIPPRSRPCWPPTSRSTSINRKC